MMAETITLVTREYQNRPGTYLSFVACDAFKGDPDLPYPVALTDRSFPVLIPDVVFRELAGPDAVPEDGIRLIITPATPTG